jgi:hypothetical protein
MPCVKQISPTIRLRELMPGPDGWGHKQGKEVFDKLRSAVESLAESHVVRISLRGVNRTDASFPRESVVTLARTLRGALTFCLVDIEDPDLLDNWDAAADKLKQSLVCWREDGGYRVLGPQPSTGNRSVFEYLMSGDVVTANQAAKALDLKLSNASMKLKQLLQQGLAMRVREAAPSGGVEFLYQRVY